MSMSTFARRDRLTILAEILKTTKESKRGKEKTDIMRGANLNCHQADKYLHLLLINGLLHLDSEDRHKTTKKRTRTHKDTRITRPKAKIKSVVTNGDHKIQN